MIRGGFITQYTGDYHNPLYTEVSINGGYPKIWMVYFMENPMNMDEWLVYFMEDPMNMDDFGVPPF